MTGLIEVVNLNSVLMATFLEPMLNTQTLILALNMLEKQFCKVTTIWSQKILM